MPVMKGKNLGGFFLANVAHASPFAVLAKTANYTVRYEDCGKLITTTGANASVTFTLPAVKKGQHYLFLNTVNQNMTVAPPTANSMIAFNDTTATTVVFSTSNNKTGGMFWVTCDGSNWAAINLSPNPQTVT